MTAVEFAPATRQSNNAALELQRTTKRLREELLKEETLTKASDEYIECLIHHKMGGSARCWKTETEVKRGTKKLQYKKDKRYGGGSEGQHQHPI